MLRRYPSLFALPSKRPSLGNYPLPSSNIWGCSPTTWRGLCRSFCLEATNKSAPKPKDPLLSPALKEAVETFQAKILGQGGAAQGKSLSPNQPLGIYSLDGNLARAFSVLIYQLLFAMLGLTWFLGGQISQMQEKVEAFEERSLQAVMGVRPPRRDQTSDEVSEERLRQRVLQTIRQQYKKVKEGALTKEHIPNAIRRRYIRSEDLQSRQLYFLGTIVFANILLMLAFKKFASLRSRYFKTVRYTPQTNSMDFEVYTLFSTRWIRGVKADYLNITERMEKENKVSKVMLLGKREFTGNQEASEGVILSEEESEGKLIEKGDFEGYDNFKMPLESSWESYDIFDAWYTQEKKLLKEQSQK